MKKAMYPLDQTSRVHMLVNHRPRVQDVRRAVLKDLEKIPPLLRECALTNEFGDWLKLPRVTKA